ncbi:MAG: carboxypeptidase regulatory-like domain-containing protein [Thermoguttaceae bacterium]|nr:carboxypeptidase regulatory-like domain-containing protein [Thermoguttaceae bacterium]
MFKKAMILSLTLLLAVMITACTPNRPKGCPKLYPCTLKVIQGGEPLAEAIVNIYPDNSELAKWPMSGLTDANGEVKLMTQTFPGAPLGSYTVTVSKVEDKHVLPPVIIEHVAEQFTLKDQSPLKIEITKKLLEPIQLDVGEAQ